MSHLLPEWRNLIDPIVHIFLPVVLSHRVQLEHDSSILAPVRHLKHLLCVYPFTIFAPPNLLIRFDVKGIARYPPRCRGTARICPTISR
jgi:hypothetical protein